MKTERIKIRGEFIRLCDLLKFAGITMTGGEAKIRIEQGEVKVNGETCTMRGKKIRGGDTVSISSVTVEVESEAD